MEILMDYKLEDIKKILKGEKHFDYRLFPIKEKISRVYLYNSELNQILGYVEVDEIFNSMPLRVWDRTKNFSGLSLKEYLDFVGYKSIVYVLSFSKVVDNSDDPLDCLNLVGFKKPKTYAVLQTY